MGSSVGHHRLSALVLVRVLKTADQCIQSYVSGTVRQTHSMQRSHSKMTPHSPCTKFPLTEITYATVCIFWLWHSEENGKKHLGTISVMQIMMEVMDRQHMKFKDYIWLDSCHEWTKKLTLVVDAPGSLLWRLLRVLLHLVLLGDSAEPSPRLPCYMSPILEIILSIQVQSFLSLILGLVHLGVSGWPLPKSW